MLPFSRNDLERLFPDKTWVRGVDLATENAVIDFDVEREGKSVTGRVRGDRRTPFLTRIKIINGRGGRVRLSSTCTCMVYSECEHAAATLIHILDRSSTPDSEDISVVVDGQLSAWIQTLNTIVRNEDDETQKSGEQLIYVLEPAQRSWREMGEIQPVNLSVVKARILRGGVFGRLTPVAFSQLRGEDASSVFSIEDQVVGRLLGTGQGHVRRLSGDADAEMLRLILQTGRCYWRTAQSAPLSLSDPQKGQFCWQFDSDGQQRMICVLEKGAPDAIMIGVGVPWYVFPTMSCCGPVETGVSRRVSQLLLGAPAVPAAAATIVRQKLQINGAAIPLPEPLRKRERLEAKPIPCIHFHSPKVNVVKGAGWNRQEIAVDLPLARVSFDYSGTEIGWQDGRAEINHVSDNRLLIIPRDALAEVQHIERLNALGLQPLGPTGLGRFAPEHCRQDFTFEEDEDDDVSLRWVEFNHNEIPRLEGQGWHVTYASDYPFRVVQSASTWRVEITDTGMDWFDVNVGIEVDGDRVQLLPLLMDLFERAPDEMSPAALDAFGDEPIYGSLPDGRLIPIAASRLKAMLAALYELFAEGGIDETGSLRLSRAEISRLETLRQRMPEGALEWSGGERIRSLAQQLAQLTDLPQVAPPKGLKATLRNYQQDGLRWLQFLSSASLSGVLADDMGLGKTLQTLAHILKEKEESRLLLPCLVVAPTSLIPTWRNESRRFTPALDLLVLHGTERQELFDEISDHDLVITSYALMLRDRDALAKHRYHMVVLDEAQAIKNPSTKLARTACELQSDHKIALSGTPIENHLGELWSIFHFLMPGYLGDRETFRRVFRNQIEKLGDTDRQALLVSRVRPFLLRRKKEDVASELPPKSEVIREIELTGPQRDLYESVRVAMSKRVRDEIASHGLARSSIAILDALLKLRQVCCDPRLLKRDKPSQDLSGGKLEMLMEMLPSMVEVGRKIILFSQFVEMLELIQEALDEIGLPYVVLTGRTRDRETPVQQFQNGEVPIFLISLRAGGTGLTLTRADTVIHYDPWWNPSVEAQATDRAHRIGQDKTVFVYKMITTGTVEEKIIELQAKKKALVEGVLSGTQAGLKFDEDDIASLFAPLPD